MKNIDFGPLLSNPFSGEFTLINFYISYCKVFEIQLQILGVGFYLEYTSTKSLKESERIFNEWKNMQPKVTRVEVIDRSKSYEDGGGRMYVNYDVDDAAIQYQDTGRTLKVFINESE